MFKQTHKLSQFSVLAIIILAVSTLAFVSPQPHEAEAHVFPPRWERLGTRKVNYRLDRDEILVTARDGRFSAIKLKVTQSPLNLRKMVVVYGNGDRQEIAIRQNFRQGGESRVIDLKGGKRVIKKVIFFYDTKGLRGRASVQLWGRR